MTVRTTVAFDPATAARLERLAKRWGVSKSETLRRALESAEKTSAASGVPDFKGMKPLEILDWLRDNPQRHAGWGEDFRRILRETRERDAIIEEEREALFTWTPTC